MEQLGDVENEHVDSNEHHDTIGRSRTVLIISSVTVVTAILEFLNGLVTVGIPVIASDLHLDASLILWYVLISRLIFFYKEHQRDIKLQQWCEPPLSVI